ncbi:type VI secretion system tip protein TssI/VgrG [Pseudomonas sp. RGM2987]|uniref:type VI secretion system Vgr family protein n=1 Tax=Pseudomonas sp. RGM2987 TaxID=2930090 RepID=UPI001FD6494F|nr:type VI secretion system tip protein TssI/VgrG [Pseudomonas sp. RGM2987]MCJ8203911.1 type VI secretion system tip protein VgrG [Pseudomonas sp. RGM2987]
MRNDMESPFSLTLTQSDLQLQVLRFNGHEALNQPYCFDLELIGLAPPISPDMLLEQPAFLRLDGESGIHGVVHSVSLSAHASLRIGYRLSLVPYLQRLEQGPRRRVFHRLSAVQMLQRLLDDNALPAASYRFELAPGQYPRRAFCIQYEESDLAFLHRLCEEEGIHYHFEHDAQGHVLVFADDPKSFPAQPLELNLQPNEGLEPTLKRLYLRHQSVNPVPLGGFNDRATTEAGTEAANQTLERIDHETLHGNPALAHRHQRGRRHLERMRCRQREIHGHSTHPALRGGHIAQIGEHPVSAFNDQWLITEVQHRGRQFSILEPDPPAEPSAQDYRNRFTAIAWSTVFRPAAKHPKPCIPGYHLAHVLGRAGQPVRPDERGEVSVSLWAPGQEGIPLPVSRLALGASTCLVAGSEVLVSFLDGDPDRPVLCPGAVDTGAGLASEAPEVPPGHTDSRLLFDWLLNPPDATP